MFNFLKTLFKKFTNKTTDISMLATPVEYISKRVKALPYDENGKPLLGVMIAIVDPGTKEITGYLPLAAVDNGDGTATIKVSA